MVIQMFSSSASTILNTTNKSQINKIKTQRWIFGMLIGSAPFLLIIFCWIFVSLCVNNFIRYYQSIKKRRQHANKKNNTMQLDAI